MVPRTLVSLLLVLLIALPAAAAGIEGVRVERNENDAFLGVYIEEEVDHPDGGARITGIVDDSAAESAGLERGDVIIGLGGQSVRGPAGLGKLMDGHAGGDRVEVQILRDGTAQTVGATLGSHAPRTTVHVDRPLFVMSDSTRGRIRGTITIDDDEALSDYLVCDGPECRFGTAAVWYRLDCLDASCPTYRVNYWGRPMLGVEVSQISDELREHFGASEGVGVLVERVMEHSPAELAGVAVGDVIVTVDGRSIDETDDIGRALRGRAGNVVDVEVVRDGRRTWLEVDLPLYDD